VKVKSLECLYKKELMVTLALYVLS